MLTATNARTNTITNLDIETEIALLNLNILEAVNRGDIYTTVAKNTNTSIMGTTVTGTPLTLNPISYLVWQNLVTDNLLTLKMGQVIDYYSQLGYTVSRKTTDGTNITWQISW